MDEETKIKIESERRAKIFYLDSQTIMALLSNGWINTNAAFLSIPVNVKFPSGAKVESCFYEPARAAFGFVVSHETFPVTNSCLVLPEERVSFEEFQIREIPNLTAVVKTAD